MKKFTEPWLIVLMFLGSAVLIEGLHIHEHEHCRSCITCEQEET